MPQGYGHTLDDLNQVKLFQEGAAFSFNYSYFDAHNVFPQPNETMIALVMKMFNRASGSSFSQPIF